MHQMAGRFRNLKDATIHALLPKSNGLGAKGSDYEIEALDEWMGLGIVEEDDTGYDAQRRDEVQRQTKKFNDRQGDIVDWAEKAVKTLGSEFDSVTLKCTVKPWLLRVLAEKVVEAGEKFLDSFIRHAIRKGYQITTCRPPPAFEDADTMIAGRLVAKENNKKMREKVLEGLIERHYQKLETFDSVHKKLNNRRTYLEPSEREQLEQVEQVLLKFKRIRRATFGLSELKLLAKRMPDLMFLRSMMKRPKNFLEDLTRADLQRVTSKKDAPTSTQEHDIRAEKGEGLPAEDMQLRAKAFKELAKALGTDGESNSIIDHVASTNWTSDFKVAAEKTDEDRMEKAKVYFRIITDLNIRYRGDTQKPLRMLRAVLKSFGLSVTPQYNQPSQKQTLSSYTVTSDRNLKEWVPHLCDHASLEKGTHVPCWVFDDADAHYLED